ncbi:MAG TPA: hypothetical protein VFP71_11920, partial [Candidatus Angelobacter sp.]|nr:hypothetical protein [Candidatus Angelobacter sp.]
QNFSFTTDREFWMPKKSKAEVEADLFCVADGILTIGEAKKENKLGNSASEEAAKIRKYKQLVNGLVARQLIFATLSAAWHSGTVEAIKAAFADLKFVKLVFLDASHLL